MTDQARKDALQRLVDHFHKISNATVAIFDANRNIIVSSAGAPFCATVRKSPAIDRLCSECDLMGFSKCAATKKPYLYACHMGLLEISAPIVFGDTLLGYIILGQFATNADKTDLYATVRAACHRAGLSADLPLQHLEDLVILQPDYIDALTGLIEMCANYIWLNQILDLSGATLAHEIRLYIANHLTEDLSINTLCTRYSLSPTALYQQCKKAFSCGPSAVIRAERIKRAKELLTQLEKPAIGDIATRVGIPDANYFSRIFKAETGMTPLAYRKQNNEK